MQWRFPTPRCVSSRTETSSKAGVYWFVKTRTKAKKINKNEKTRKIICSLLNVCFSHFLWTNQTNSPKDNIKSETKDMVTSPDLMILIFTLSMSILILSVSA